MVMDTWKRPFNVNSFKMKTKIINFWLYWSLNSGPHTYYAGTLPLEPLHQSFFCVGYFSDRVSRTIYPG
jgi:hypothetical protein